MSSIIARSASDLQALGCPAVLCDEAWAKIIAEQFDAGNYVQFGMRDIDESNSDDVNSESNEVKAEDVTIEGLDDEEQESEVPEVRGSEVSAPSMYSLHAKDGLKAFSTVMLIDHMWVTTFPQSRIQLRQLPELRNRLGAALGIPCDADTEAGASLTAHIEAVWTAMWPHLTCASADHDAYTSWVCMDEVGLALTHSPLPNMAIQPVTVVVPSNDGMSFVKQNLTLSWPIEDIEEGDLLTRDYLQSVRPPSGIEGSDMLAVNLITSLQSIGLLRPELFSKASEYAEDSPVKRVLNDSLTRMLKPLFDATPDVRAKSSTISAADSFNVSDFKDTSSAVSEVPIALRRQIVLPAWQGRLDKLKAIRETGQPLKIYMDKVVYLWGQLQGASASRISESDPSTKCPIILVDTPEEADVLYLIDHTYVDADGNECEHFKGTKIMNQFWWEGLLVTKNMLARTMNRFFGVYQVNIEGASSQSVMDGSRLPVWFPVSFDLDVPMELWAFINEFYQRTDNGYWILKRIIGRMSVDYPVTNLLQCCLRHCEGVLKQQRTDAISSTRVSRVASKYVLHPTTFRGRKFDVRFYLVVTSLYPLKIQRHEAFVVRLSNDVYSADNFEDFQKHFTLMSLLDDEEMKSIRQPGTRTHVKHPDWIRELNDELKVANRLQPRMCGYGGPSDEELTLVQWETHLMPRMHHAVATVFKAAQAAALQESPPEAGGIALNAGWSLNQPNASPAMAVYGVDIMIDSDYNPAILEIQWSPDAEKACLHTPTFWEDMMRALYLGGTTNMLSIYDEELA